MAHIMADKDFCHEGYTCKDCRWKTERSDCPWDYEYDDLNEPFAEDCIDFRNINDPNSAFKH